MAKHQDITDSIERMEPFESRFSVTIEALYASLSGPDDDGDYNVLINGELHTTGSLELEESLELVATTYDSKGRVVSNETTSFDSDSFHMFETFAMSFYVKGIKPVKIRLYPKKY